MLHGEADQVVKFPIGQLSFAAIQEARPQEHSARASFKSYRGMGHSSSEQEMADVAQWMATILGKE